MFKAKRKNRIESDSDESQDSYEVSFKICYKGSLKCVQYRCSRY